MIPSLDNFIDFGKDVFAQSPDYRRMAIDVYVSAMTEPELGDPDRVHGCALGESILLNMRGHVDHVCLLASDLPSSLKFITDRRTWPLSSMLPLISSPKNHASLPFASPF